MATKARIPGSASIEYTTDPPNTVVVGTGGAAMSATTVPVLALQAAIPSGAVLDFGGTKVATLSAPALLGATSLTVTALPAALLAGDTTVYASWTRISEATTIDIPTQTASDIEASNLDSVNLQIENISGWTANANINIEANWTGDASQTALFPLFNTRTNLGWRVTVPNRTSSDITGYVWMWRGDLTRCTNSPVDPKGLVKLLLTCHCNSPSRSAAPAVA